MKAYALDLRQRVVNFIKSGGSKAEAARRFALGRSTVYRYLDAVHAGTLAPKKSWGHWRKLDPQKLQAHVQKHPDATLKELQQVFGVSHHAIWVRLAQLVIHSKKTHIISGAQRSPAVAVPTRTRTLQGIPVFDLDECGVDHRLYREYGRAPRGERIYQEVAGKRRERTSLIAASQQGKLVAPRGVSGCLRHRDSGQLL